MRQAAVLLTIITFLAAVPALAAQDEGHVVEVSGLVSRDAVRPGETFQAAVVLRIQAGYHVNDNAPLDEFLIPTVLTVLSRSTTPAADGPASPTRKPSSSSMKARSCWAPCSR
jgi:hypothetical protein